MIVTTGGRADRTWIGFSSRAPALEVGVSLLKNLGNCSLVSQPRSSAHLCRGVVVDLLIDVGHDPELHQLFDDLDSGRFKFFGQLRDGQYGGE